MLILLMICIVFSLLATQSEYLTNNKVNLYFIAGPLFFLASLVSNVYVILLLRYLQYSKSMVRLCGFYTFIFSPIVVFLPSFLVLPDVQYARLYTVVVFIVISYLLFVAVVILKDIFRSNITRQDHLWGAVVVYCYLLLFFSYLFRLILLWDENAIGITIEGRVTYIFHSMVVSLNAATGMSYLYPKSVALIHTLMNFEHWITNLFLIVILGRLLSNPLEKRMKKE